MSIYRNNLRRLVQALQHRMLDIDQVQEELNVAVSAARKYLYQLEDANVVTIDHYTEARPRAMKGHAVYMLTKDTAVVDQFLVLADANEVPPPARRRPIPDPEKTGRRFHLLSDDQAINFNSNLRQVMRDPLVAAFFGEARPCAS
jgi:uncharacterized protein (UPF0212 family)